MLATQKKMDTGPQIVHYQVLVEIPQPEPNTLSAAVPIVETKSLQQSTVSVLTEPRENAL